MKTKLTTTISEEVINKAKFKALEKKMKLNEYIELALKEKNERG